MAGYVYANPNGAVMIADGGVPRIITVKARANISGGYWVLGSSAQGAVGSDSSTYAASDIEGYNVATQVGSEVIGLALQDISSGTYGPVAMRGIFLLPELSGTRIGSIYSGWSVVAGSAGTVMGLGSNTLLTPLGGAVGVGADGMKIGKALTSTDGTGQFLAVSLNV